jgi:hypothetical protein
MEKVFDEVGGGGCIFIIIDILIFRVSKTLWTVKVTNFNWGSNSCTTSLG